MARFGFWLGAEGEEQESAPDGVAPGRRSITEALPVQRKAARAPATSAGAGASVSGDAGATASANADDVFGMHLLGAPVQRQERGAATAAGDDEVSLDALFDLNVTLPGDAPLEPAGPAGDEEGDSGDGADGADGGDDGDGGGASASASPAGGEEASAPADEAAAPANAAESQAAGDDTSRERRGRGARAPGSAVVPDLPAATVQLVDGHLAAGRKQAAIDALVRAAARRGRIDPRLLVGGTMTHDSSISGEGLASIPGYRRDGQARRTRVRIGDDAFVSGVPLLYSSILHEYQHVLQFQRRGRSPSAVPGQGSNQDLADQQEVEAYGWEILHSRDTGLFRTPKLMEDAWLRLHNTYWINLNARRKRPLRRLVQRAHLIAERATGKSLVFTP